MLAKKNQISLSRVVVLSQSTFHLVNIVSRNPPRGLRWSSQLRSPDGDIEIFVTMKMADLIGIIKQANDTQKWHEC